MSNIPNNINKENIVSAIQDIDKSFESIVLSDEKLEGFEVVGIFEMVLL